MTAYLPKKVQRTLKMEVYEVRPYNFSNSTPEEEQIMKFLTDEHIFKVEVDSYIKHKNQKIFKKGEKNVTKSRLPLPKTQKKSSLKKPIIDKLDLTKSKLSKKRILPHKTDSTN